MPRATCLFLAIGFTAACGERHRPPAAAPPAPPVTDSPAAGTGAPVADAGSSTGACEGARLSLLAAIANPSCRITESEADRLRDMLEDPTKAPLKVGAERLPDGRVKVRITNTGSAAQELPLLVHSLLDNFSVSANGRALEAPDPDWPPGFSFEVGRMLARIVLAPGGTAEATLRINTQLISHELRNCPPNAKCAPTTVQHGKLPAGAHSLKIGTPLYSIREDLKASIQWTAP